MSGLRIGHGFDTHALVEGRPLVLGGVALPHTRGLAGHSDGDVLFHAVTSALLGALGEGDLGLHFPSSDASLAGIDSGVLLERVCAMLPPRGLVLANLDTTIVAQEPRLAPHLDALRASLARRVGAAPERVNVKATSTDQLGAIGRGEGIAAFAVVLLEPGP